ncbi:MAG: protein kinase [Okeania sp. SIO3B3]|nr:protein kinase [Okeania sp. SIO3B3]
MSQCLNPECLNINPDNFQFCQKCGDKLLLVERYWAKSILGQGGFGRTFLAVDEFKPSKPPCVIKQFLPQAQGTETVAKAAELFAQEAERLELLGKHPQIPELYAYFSVDSRQYLVQEFIQGETLQQELDNHGVFNESQIRELLIDLLSVLQFVHSHNVIHRDIKPENIIRREADKKLVLVDFGASKIMPKTQRRTVTGTVIGSAEYCAPEQSMGKAKSGSDLYSLGVTCLHLLTQMSPFDLYDVMEMEWVWRNYLNGNFVSDELGKVLDSLVEQKPKQRYQKVEDVLAELEFANSSISTTENNQQPPQNFVSTDALLVRFIGVDYTQLRNLLAVGKWQEADEETERCMLKIARREKEGWLREEDIDNFPCKDLRNIDHLWVRYSHGKFGFSVQRQIYQNLGGSREYDKKVWEKFGDQVGWRCENKWLKSVYIFGFDYKKKRLEEMEEGHLPLCDRVINYLVQRLVDCSI